MITIPDSIKKHVLFIGGKEYGVFTYKSSKEDFLKYSFGLSKKEKEDISSGKTSFEYTDVTVNISKEEKSLLEGLHKHAEENYENGGWDYMVEGWDTYEMIIELREKKFANLESAIAYYQEIYGCLDDRRKDIQAIAY